MSENRRPVGSRKVPLFQKLAITLVRLGLTPNQVSVASCGFALLGAFGFLKLNPNSLANFWLSVLLAFAGIQLRLICNLIDGLMAVEGGKKTVTGEIYNDLPDRFSDLLLIVAAGYAVNVFWVRELAWLAAVFAILTAYVRVLGASMGAGHNFSGPMAKQHRMAILNLALLGTCVEHYFGRTDRQSLQIALIIILVGSVFTVMRRLVSLVRLLNQKS